MAARTLDLRAAWRRGSVGVVAKVRERLQLHLHPGAADAGAAENVLPGRRRLTGDADGGPYGPRGATT